MPLNTPLPCIIVDASSMSVEDVGAAIRLACTVSLEQNAKNWRQHREENGIPHPQEDPEGFSAWIQRQYDEMAVKP